MGKVTFPNRQHFLYYSSFIIQSSLFISKELLPAQAEKHYKDNTIAAIKQDGLIAQVVRACA